MNSKPRKDPSIHFFCQVSALQVHDHAEVLEGSREKGEEGRGAAEIGEEGGG